MSKTLMFGALLGTMVLNLNCVARQRASDVETTSVVHSAVKMQAIGNCWVYAMASWAEGLHKSATGEEVDISESYWTYWHWYDQITNRFLHMPTIDTAGSWTLGEYLVDQRGFMYEHEFVVADAGKPMSTVQGEAEEMVNAALGPGGELETKESRTPENAIRLLDKAFHVDMNEAKTRAHKLSEFLLGVKDQTPFTLQQAMFSGDLKWDGIGYPTVKTTATPEIQAKRKALLERIFRALNDHQPVVMQVFVDFNALDPADGTFKISTLQAAGGPGRQGVHMVVLEDYVVDNVTAPDGSIVSVGEGEVADDLKERAIKGNLRYFVAKNSWGTNRPDRGLTDGRTRFHVDYLDQPILRKKQNEFASSAGYFVLPPGY
ncbi:MAG: hypothetical protein AB7T49_11095 [Oligoflexales bacterium]